MTTVVDEVVDQLKAPPHEISAASLSLHVCPLSLSQGVCRGRSYSGFLV